MAAPISGGFQVQNATLLDKDDISKSPFNRETSDRYQRISELERTDVEKAKENESFLDDKVHTRFKAGGETIAIHFRDNGTFFSGNSPPSEARAAIDQADQLGLTGEARANFVANGMAEGFRQVYGDRLEVETFSREEAPTRAEIRAERQGFDSTETFLRAEASRMNLNNEAFQILMQAKEG